VVDYHTLTYQFTFIFYPSQGPFGQVPKTALRPRGHVLVSLTTW